MKLDPYLVKAVAGVTSKQIYDAFARLYADADPNEGDYLPWIEKWLGKLRTRPGLALSTGRRNSLRGVLTCALLDVLGVARPKAERDRMTLAWAILRSPVGYTSIGHTPELDAEWEEQKDRYILTGKQIENIYETPDHQ